MGCGCGLLAMIGIALIFLALSIVDLRGRFDPTRDTAAYASCQRNLIHIGLAIASYRQDYRTPPDRLQQLSPHYLDDPARLRCPLAAIGLGRPYRYTPTPARPTDPLVTCVNHGQGPISLLHDGRLRLPK